MKRTGVKLGLSMGMLALCLAAVGAAMKHEHTLYTGSAEFERIKSLAGIWEGTAVTEGQDAQAVRVVYQVTSGGSAVSEKILVDSPDEMVSIYYDRGKRLAMTHYCAQHNRPLLELKNATPSEITLALVSGGEVSATEPHMHALKLAFPAPDKLVQTWTAWENGKPTHDTVLTLTRAK